MKPLNCPKCGSPESKVFNSRRGAQKAGDIGAVWRRRQCDSCRRRFTTYEIAEKDFEAFMAYRKAIMLLSGDDI